VRANGGMSDTEKSTAEQYRDKAEEIRLAAWRARTPEIRVQLFDLAERYERMAAHAGRRGSDRPPPEDG